MGDVYTNPPQSRNEAILNSIVEGTTYTAPPQSRIEDLLLQVKDVIEEGGHDESATRASIAPTESDSAHASKNIAVGEQFYLSDDKLYTATSTISQGSAIVVYPTASYNCKLSDSVTGQIASGLRNTDAVVESTVGWIGKNLCPKFNPTTSATVVFTVDDDSVVTANGTASGTNGTDTVSFVANRSRQVLLTGCSYVDDNAHLFPYDNTSSSRPYKDSTKTVLQNDDQYGNEPLSFWMEKDHQYTIYIRVRMNTTVTNEKFYPMIRDADITDSDYEPYHASVAVSLAEKTDNSVIGKVEDGATCANPNGYAVGKHFTRNGAFCTVTSNISANESLVGSNKFTSGDVASICADVTKTSYTNTNANITIDSERDVVIRQGNIIFMRIRFTVLNNITSGEELFSGAGSFSGVQFLSIINLSAPYTVVNHAYINENGLCSVNKIDAGTYEVVGSYICK